MHPLEGSCHAIIVGGPPRLALWRSVTSPLLLDQGGSCSRGGELACGRPAPNSAFIRRVRRPAETENLLQDGVKIHLLLYLVQSRVFARDLACPADQPGSGDCVLAKA